MQTNPLSSQIAMMVLQAARYLTEGEIPQQAGNNHPTTIPAGVFNTSDGAINIVPGSSTMYTKFCKLLGLDDCIDDPRFATPAARSTNRDELNAMINAIAITQTSAHWIEKLTALEIPNGPIYHTCLSG